MKKLALIALCAAVLSLSGCAARYDEKYGSDVSAFIDPYDESQSVDFLPETSVASESATDSSQEGNTTENPPEGYGTFDVTPKIVGDTLIGKGFRFEMPYPWTCDNISATVTNANDQGYDISTYTFYYVEADGDKAVMLELEVVPENYFYLNLATDTDSIGTSSDETKVYLIVRQEALPSSFADLETYLDIYKKMTSTIITITE